jgi:hypothetical protein
LEKLFEHQQIHIDEDVRIHSKIEKSG